jgi:hypothetical protein
MTHACFIKRLFILILLFCVSLQLSGCTALQRKFTRKKKKPKLRIPAYKPIKEYDRRPTPELYKKHFVYWKTWQSSLIQTIGESKKRDIRAIKEIIGNLKDLKSMLTSEKAAELQSHIDKIVLLEERVSRRSLTKYDKDSVVRVLEKQERQIERSFRYDKIKDYLKE